jgi:ketosteroid isomerase-like protein
MDLTMSHEMMDVVRAMMQAFSRGDAESALALLHPDVEFDATARPDGRVWRGRDGVRQAMAEWVGAWNDYRLTVEQLIDAGDRVICLWTERGRGKASGAELEIRGGSIYTVSGGLITHMVGYDRREKALEATSPKG